MKKATPRVERRAFKPLQDGSIRKNVTGILNGELVSATSFASSPATATMAVWQKDSSGNMVDSTRDITVVNRMIKISLPAGTIAQAEWIDGEWRIYAADCA